jgi:hypothetical protein
MLLDVFEDAVLDIEEFEMEVVILFYPSLQ